MSLERRSFSLGKKNDGETMLESRGGETHKHESSPKGL